MTFTRKLELGCAVLVGILEIAISFTMFHFGYQSDQTDRLLDYFLTILMCYLLPGGLTVFASYLPAVKQKSLGQGLLIVGCSSCILAMWAALYAFAAGGGMPKIWGLLNLITLLMACITLLVSFAVEWQNRKAISPPASQT